MNSEIGKSLILIGAVILIIGLAITFLPKGGSVPRFPGDILIKKENFTFYFPLATSILISVILSLIFYLFFKR